VSVSWSSRSVRESLGYFLAAILSVALLGVVVVVVVVVVTVVLLILVEDIAGDTMSSSLPI